MQWIDVSLHGVLEKQIGHRHQGHTHQHTGQASKGKETGKSLCREGSSRYRATPDTVGRLRTHDQSLEGTMEAGRKWDTCIMVWKMATLLPRVGLWVG